MNCYLGILVLTLSTTNGKNNESFELHTIHQWMYYTDMKTLIQMGVHIFHSKTEHTRFKHNLILISVCSGILDH